MPRRSSTRRAYGPGALEAYPHRQSSGWDHQGYKIGAFGMPFHWTSLWISVAITLGLLVYSAFYFKSTERTFADIV
ncbi:MAG: hypothetical protein IPL01_24340 [Acidobacteria bacterium]|nr:hypothetical protein [Acidobacteriota bacterium]